MKDEKRDKREGIDSMGIVSELCTVIKQEGKKRNMWVNQVIFKQGKVSL